MNKKIITILYLILLVVASSCGSSKKISTGEEKVEVSKSQNLAEQKPATRAFGEGTNYNMSFAKSYAENQARGAFLRQMEAIVKNGIKNVNAGDNQYGSDSHVSEQATNQGETMDAVASTIAEGTLRNTVVIHTDTYRKKDGQYHVYVCIEYQGSVAKLAEEMAQGYENAVKKRVSDEEHAKVEERGKKLQDEIDKALQKRDESK